MQPLIELTDSLNWNIAYRAEFAAVLNSYGGIVESVAPVNFVLNSHAMVIGVYNEDAPGRWRLGGWMQVIAPAINTGSTTSIDEQVEVVRQTLTLGTRHLIRIPAYGIQPYRVRVSFPKWHTKIKIEAWWYDSDRYDPIQEMLKEINSKL